MTRTASEDEIVAAGTRVRLKTQDRIIENMKEDYVKGRWTLEQLEDMIWNRLNGKTPVNAQGWPLYYEPEILDACTQID